MNWREFQIGEVVRVIDRPKRDCRVGWYSDMDEYCGMTATVVAHTSWTNGVLLDIDEGVFVWDAEIIEKVTPPCEVSNLDTDESVDISDMFQ